MGKWFNDIAAHVGELSGGKLKIQPYFSSQLGDEQTVIRQSVRGRGRPASPTRPRRWWCEFALLAAPYSEALLTRTVSLTTMSSRSLVRCYKPKA